MQDCSMSKSAALPVLLGSQAKLAWSDRLGIYASAACVVHCMVTPVLLSFSVVFAHLLPSEERTHRTFAVAVAALGAIALIRGLRRHRRKVVAWLMAGGLACIFLTAMFGDDLPHHWMEVAITLAGSVAMITAHRLNHTFCGACSCASGAGHDR
jgi:peptidoglycan/LPS O-acetylase OafA/YrhL